MSDELRDILYYDPITGIFTWKIRINNFITVGRIAGTISSQGYLKITFRGHAYRGHRLAWFFQTGKWPAEMIDHINGIRSDNRFVNLREATNSENQHNTGKPVTNTSGFKGVGLDRKTERWKARIRVRGKMKHLGSFDTPEAAYAVYCKTAEQHVGGFARRA